MQSLEKFPSFLTEIWRHQILTSRRNFDDVITPSFVSATSWNFVKCFLLTKYASCENFIIIELVEHAKLESRQKWEKIRHFSDLKYHNSVKSDVIFVKLSQMLDHIKINVLERVQVHSKSLSSYFFKFDVFKNPAGQFEGGGMLYRPFEFPVYHLGRNFWKIFLNSNMRKAKTCTYVKNL